MEKNLTSTEALFEIDERHIWHPYTQHKIAPKPFLVKSAKGEFLNIIDQSGEEKKLIDGISSWWVNIHGHSHPYINERLKKQVDDFEHVIFAGFTHEPAIKLVEKLLPLLPKVDISTKKQRLLKKAFFSDNGSTAVEVGIKMAVQYWFNKNQKKNRIIAFEDSYHGDTIGTMSTSNTPIFHQAFKEILFPVDFVASPGHDRKTGTPFTSNFINENEDIALEQMQALFEKYPGEHAAVLIEPLVQGAGGMKFHSEKFLQRLRALCDMHEVLLIADEVFVGFGRTGKMFATEKAMIVPDIICLSKGLTGGYFPLGLTVATDEIYEAFHSDSRMKTFFHGHSFTGNPLSITAALASLELFLKEDRLKDVDYINSRLNLALNVPELINMRIVKDIRIIGALAVIELKSPKGTDDYLSEIGPVLTEEFLRRQILLRPLGNTLYFLPPYTISVKSLDYCLESIKDVLINLNNSINPAQ